MQTEHLEIRNISPYSVQIRENADQNNFEDGHFLRSEDPHRDLNFKLKGNGSSSKSLREIKCNRYFYMCVTKLTRPFFRYPFFDSMIESRKGRTIFYLPW